MTFWFSSLRSLVVVATLVGLGACDLTAEATTVGEATGVVDGSVADGSAGRTDAGRPDASADDGGPATDAGATDAAAPSDTGGFGDAGSDACASAEACNGVDDDCDGAVDEDVPPRACGSDVGRCVMGTQACEGGGYGTCMGQVGPRAERCDGVDDDCDGAVDEDVAAMTCGSDVGRCAAGLRTCVDGSFSACIGRVGPRAERCDGVDDDCDGATDEGIAPQTCGTNVGTCRTGTRRCVGGRFEACRGNVGPVAEVDDGLDNDCDGSIDEGIPCEDDRGRRVRVATNAERRSRGLATLRCDNGLRRAAQAHADDMCRTGVFSHTSADGRTLVDRLAEARATYTLAGENLARGPGTPEGIVTAWMGSPAHRDNILNGRFRRLGVGYASCGSGPYWVQVFAD